MRFIEKDELILEIVSNMKTITISECHHADSIIDDIQEKINLGELKTSDIETAVEIEVEKTMRNIQRYSTHVLKIMNGDGEVKQLMKAEYTSILRQGLIDRIFLDQKSNDDEKNKIDEKINLKVKNIFSIVNDKDLTFTQSLEILDKVKSLIKKYNMSENDEVISNTIFALVPDYDTCTIILFSVDGSDSIKLTKQNAKILIDSIDHQVQKW
ncbi:MAG: hypothetical protein N4A40_01595 [Tissierellales bacterium]|nr:hypothetical protein [Tissierellales bacterium]